MTKADEALAALEQWAGTGQPSAQASEQEDQIEPLTTVQKNQLWQLLSSPEKPAAISSQVPR
mgnify:CR=1 FL=1